MKKEDIQPWCHEHIFLGKRQEANERRTRIVIGLTAIMMVLEIASGMVFGSMALLADGWHMASHAAALGITALGYFFARRHASDKSYSFGTGKIGDLAGFSSALLLAFIALLMAYESITRFFSPVSISFDEAIGVAVLGLIVNIVSALLLKETTPHHDHSHRDHHHGADHNIKAAYLHVLADALTSVLAIAALTTGRFLGWIWMDPFMGIVGAAVISRWSYHLMTDTGRILLDKNRNDRLNQVIREQIESDGDTHVTDLHVWRIAPGRHAAIVSVFTEHANPPSYYKKRISSSVQLCHITVEVNVP